MLYKHIREDIERKLAFRQVIKETIGKTTDLKIDDFRRFAEKRYRVMVFDDMADLMNKVGIYPENYTIFDHSHGRFVERYVVFMTGVPNVDLFKECHNSIIVAEYDEKGDIEEIRTNRLWPDRELGMFVKGAIEYDVPDVLWKFANDDDKKLLLELDPERFGKFLAKDK